jgi:hypothetical protein
VESNGSLELVPFKLEKTMAQLQGPTTATTPVTDFCIEILSTTHFKVHTHFSPATTCKDLHHLAFCHKHFMRDRKKAMKEFVNG